MSTEDSGGFTTLFLISFSNFIGQQDQPQKCMPMRYLKGPAPKLGVCGKGLSWLLVSRHCHRNYLLSLAFVFSLQVKGIGPRFFSAPKVCDPNFDQITLLRKINPISSLSCLPGLNHCSPQASEQRPICRTTRVQEGNGKMANGIAL